MKELVVRKGTVAESPAIAQFQIDMAWETERMKLSPETILPGVESVFHDESRGFYLVGEIQQKVISSLLITYEWSDWRNGNIWYLQSVFVEQPFRGQGIFKRMYHEVLQMAKSSGARRIRLYVEKENQRAQQVYQASGMAKLPYDMFEAEI